MAFLAPLCLALLLLVQSSAASSANSITYDETFYAGCGEDTALQRRLHPMLLSAGTAPLPILACYVGPALLMRKMPRANCWHAGPNDRRLVAKARMANAVLSGVTLMLLVYGWLYLRRGMWAAVVGATLVTFSPSVLAHVSLAATDAMFTTAVVIVLAALAWHASAPSPTRLLALGAAWGVAYSAKYSGVFLGPTIAIVLLVAGRYSDAGLGWWKTTVRVAGQLVVLVPVALLVTWALHGFAWEVVPGPLRPRAPLDALIGLAPISGLMRQIEHNHAGHPAFLRGEVAQLGWWYYYLYVWLVKSTPAEWLTAGLVLATLARGTGWAIDRWRARDVSFLAWLVAGTVYLGLLLTSHIDSGVRFALPLYPLLFLLGVDQLWSATDRRRVLRHVAAALLILVQIASAVSSAPQYLSYFIPLIGPERGWRLLADSNIDWGQDLIRLRETLRAIPSQRVLFKYFGTASPEAYGIVSAPWWPGSGQSVADYDLLAVSVTYLHGLWLEDDPFRALRAIQPVARAGHSIFVYDLHDPVVRDAVAASLR